MSAETIPVSLTQRVSALVEETVAGTPVYVVEVVVRGRAGSRVLDVFLDSDEPLGVDQLANISREIGLLLEAGDMVSGAYRLNVSTPGVDRPLMPRQFPRNVGRSLRVRFAADEAVTTIEGTLTAVDSEVITVSDSSGVEHRIAVENIQEAKVMLPW